MKEKNQKHKLIIITTCLLITIASIFKVSAINQIGYDTVNVKLRYNKKIVNDFSKVSIYIVLKDTLALKQTKNVFLAPLNFFNNKIQTDCYIILFIKNKNYTLKVPFIWLKSLVWNIEIKDYGWCKKKKYKANYGYSFRASGFGLAG